MAKFLVLVLLLLGFWTEFRWGRKLGIDAPFRIHTLFFVECQNYFDWQTVGFMHRFKKSRRPGKVTRLPSCTDEEKKNHRGMNLAPTLEVPSMGRHPRTGDCYPAINKPAGIVHSAKT